MPNNKKGSGQGIQDPGRQSQGQQGGYGNTSREAGGSRQDTGRSQDFDRSSERRSGSQSNSNRSGGMSGNDDEM